jgi:hypothetical protein
MKHAAASAGRQFCQFNHVAISHLRYRRFAWLAMREMLARRVRNGEEDAMANREQKGNREKRKPKKDKTKAVATPTVYAATKK